MRYVSLVHGDEAELKALSDPQSRELTRDSLDYDNVLKQAGYLVVAHALESPVLTTCLKTRGGKVVATDGPFRKRRSSCWALLIEAKDRDEALAIASKVPMLQYGRVEVRAIMRLEGAVKPPVSDCRFLLRPMTDHRPTRGGKHVFG